MKPSLPLTIFLLLMPLTVQPQVRRTSAPSAPDGLDGKNIALWPSHGLYYSADDDRWKFQRSRLFGTVEDLYSQSYVIPFLIPMLENAGAYVMTPRERDLNPIEIIIDNDGMKADSKPAFHSGTEHWTTADGMAGFARHTSTLKGRENPFRCGTVEKTRTVTDKRHASTASWNAPIPQKGEYAVYISYASTPSSTSEACYTVNSATGAEKFIVDQRSGGGTWIYLGTFPFEAGRQEKPIVELTNLTSKARQILTADAVKIGGGMGNVERGGRTSGKTRRIEGARYWLQWAGAPDSVYAPSDPPSDYVDDYKSRGLWVNWLTGGSRSNPDAEGLGIPIDLSLAFHTDAGVTTDGSTVGTLAIVSYGKKDRLGNGELRSTVEDLAETVAAQTVSDIRQIYDPNWNRRKTRNRAYHEAASPVVPALLIELLSHQNFTDMKLGLNPEFRFDVSRAIYKGIVRYLASKNGRKVTIQPLPVNSFGITGSDKDYILSWKPTTDSIEPTATPDYYIVEQRINDGAFSRLAEVTEPWFTFTADDDEIYSFRITAVNRGGKSFPSETLSLCRKGNSDRQVMIVNGFTRLSGPDITDTYDRRGMDYSSDHGVAYGNDLAFTGEQIEFRPGIEWTHDDSPGSGASRADYDGRIVAGNSFDNVYIHGKALREADIPFISSSRDAFIASMPETRYMDLILGKQKEVQAGVNRRHKTFIPELRNAIERYAAGGGNILVSGCYVAGDMFANPLSDPETTANDGAWCRKVLGYELSSSKASTDGKVYGAKTKFNSLRSLPEMKFNTDPTVEIYAAESPEAIKPAGGGNGVTAMRYAENGFPAAVACEKTGYKTFIAGWPLETVADTDALSNFFSSIMDFFTAPAVVVTDEDVTVKKTVAKSNTKTKKSKSRSKTKKRKKK